MGEKLGGFTKLVRGGKGGIYQQLRFGVGEV